MQDLGTTMTITGERSMIEGKIVRLAKPHAWPQQEWFEDVEQPEMLIDALRKSKDCPDILTFWQRLPDTEPRYPYQMEWIRSQRSRLRATPFGGRNKSTEKPETRSGKLKRTALL